MEISQDLADNYEQLRLERGWSTDELADYVETMDVRLAKHIREKGLDPTDAVAARHAARTEQADLDAQEAAVAGDTAALDAELLAAFASKLAALSDEEKAELKAELDAMSSDDNADPDADPENDPDVGGTVEGERAAGEARRDELVPPVEEPAGNASTEAWAEFAVRSGRATEGEVEGLTRNELREKFGTPSPAE